MLDDKITITPEYQHQLALISNAEQVFSDDAKISRVVEWVQNYLAKPHKDLGRSGAVCPFVPFSLESDSIYLAKIDQANLDAASVTKIIKKFGDLFLQKTGCKHAKNLNNAFIIVFTSLNKIDLVDEVQDALKPYFVEQGLMLGEFHSNNDGAGLRNPAFKPLRSPVPLLAIRHMVDSDLPFMISSKYSIEERTFFLRSYLRNLKGELNDVQFTKSLNTLINFEIELHTSNSVEFGQGMDSQCSLESVYCRGAKRES
jgi:hypothetical protein